MDTWAFELEGILDIIDGNPHACDNWGTLITGS